MGRGREELPPRFGCGLVKEDQEKDDKLARENETSQPARLRLRHPQEKEGSDTLGAGLDSTEPIYSPSLAFLKTTILHCSYRYRFMVYEEMRTSQKNKKMCILMFPTVCCMHLVIGTIEE